MSIGARILTTAAVLATIIYLVAILLAGWRAENMPQPCPTTAANECHTTMRPPPARKLMPFRAEAARIGRISVDCRELTRHCKITLRDSATLYSEQGTIVGHLHGYETDPDGVVWLNGEALPMVAQQLNDRTMFPSIDARTHWRNDNPLTLSEFEITSAMVTDIAAYPWQSPVEGAADVRP